MKNLLLLLSIALSPLWLFSQTLEVEGQAKITVMNSDPSAQNIVVRQADGTLAIRDASTLTDADSDPNNELELPQSPASGEMYYWDGTAWVSIPTGTDGQTLVLCAGVPTWTTTGVCPPPPPTVTSTTGKIWMDRNLGATQVAISSSDAAAYGDLYQWGRDTDGHQVRTSGTTTTLSITDQPGHGDFIINTSQPYDWRSPANDNLWQGVNGINNPCPTGYRLPTETEWNAERVSWNTNNSSGAFGSPLKLPAAGFRSINDVLSVVGSFGYYWSSTVSVRLYFATNNSDTRVSPRSGGLSVRCIKN